MHTGTDDTVLALDRVSQLPPELLGEIFTYASLLDPDAPLVVGEVSTLFHRTVRATPHAWCRLRLVLSPSFSCSHSHPLSYAYSVTQPEYTTEDADAYADARCIRKAELWFARARALLVDVVVELPPPPSSGQPSFDDPGARNHTHIPLRERGSHARQQQQQQPTTTMKDAQWQDMRADVADVLLPHVLCNFNQRIRGLELRTTTADEARVFLRMVYPHASMSMALMSMALVGDGDGVEGGVEDEDEDGGRYPLRSLVLHASSDGSRHFVPHRHRAQPHRPLPPSSASASANANANATPRRIGPATCTPTPTDALALPPLPHLAHLAFHNYPLPPLVEMQSSVRYLTALSVHYPLRFAPIPVSALLGVLRAAGGLERLEVEARVGVDGVGSSAAGAGGGAGSRAAQQYANAASSLMPPSFPSSLDTAPDLSSTTTASSQSPTQQQQRQQRHHAHAPLVPLPRLAHLHLRINNLPALLSQLLLPALSTLSVDDLDGKRAGAARETGEVLRGLLVRMEMPFDGVGDHEGVNDGRRETEAQGRGPERGLEVLDMCNIALPMSAADDDDDERGRTGPAAQAVHAHPHMQIEVEADADAGMAQMAHEEAETETYAVWAWCFRRMRTLRELRARKMDVDALLALVTPRGASAGVSRRSGRSERWAREGGGGLGGVGGGGRGRGGPEGRGEGDAQAEAEDDAPLPALKKLVIIEQDAYHPRASAGLHRMNAQHGHAHGCAGAGGNVNVDVGLPSPSSSSTGSLAGFAPPPLSPFDFPLPLPSSFSSSSSSSGWWSHPTSTTSPHSQNSDDIQHLHLHPHPHRGPLVKFQLTRPDVEVVYDAFLDPAVHHHMMAHSQSAAALCGGVDFLDLYAGR